MKRKYKKNWHKSLKISCVVHFLAIIVISVVSSNLVTSNMKLEECVSVDLNVPEVQKVAVTESKSGSSGETVSSLPMKQQEQKSEATKSMDATQISSSNHKIAVNHHNGAGLISTSSVEETTDGSDQIVSENVGSGSDSTIEIHAVINSFVMQVEQNKEYPYMALKRGQTGTVTVFVRIAENGDLSAVKVVNSSGIKSLDDSAVKAVKKSCPFIHHVRQTLEMEIPIHYELNG